MEPGTSFCIQRRKKDASIEKSKDKPRGLCHFEDVMTKCLLIRSAVAALMLSGLNTIVAAQTPSVLCTVTPFHASSETTIVPTEAVPGIQNALQAHVTLQIPLGTRPSKIHFLSVRYQNRDTVLVTFQGVQTTVKLSGQTVTHGIEIQPATGYGTAPEREIDVSRQVTFYADPSSSFVFNVNLMWFINSPPAGGDLTVTIVGVTTPAGCSFSD
jgi:hypothetical protein